MTAIQTPEKQAEFSLFAREWIRHGISTEPCNLQEAMRFGAIAYAETLDANDQPLPPPKHYHLLDSPFQSVLAQWIMKQVWNTDKLDVLTNGTLLAPALVSALRQVNFELMQGGESEDGSPPSWSTSPLTLLPAFHYAAQRLALSLTGRHEEHESWAHDESDVREINAMITANKAAVPGFAMIHDLVTKSNNVTNGLRDCGKELVYGNHECRWLAAHDWLVNHEGQTNFRPLTGIIGLAQHCGWWSSYDENMFCQHRLSELKYMDDQVPTPKEGDTPSVDPPLHCLTGPAIAYRDGWRLFFLENVKVPPKVVLDPSSQTIDEIVNESNDEVRRLRLQQYGMPKFLMDSDAKIIHTKWNDVEGSDEALMESQHLGTRRFMVFNCPSTGRIYASAVPIGTKTCEEGQMFLSSGLSSDTVMAS